MSIMALPWAWKHRWILSNLALDDESSRRTRPSSSPIATRLSVLHAAAQNGMHLGNPSWLVQKCVSCGPLLKFAVSERQSEVGVGRYEWPERGMEPSWRWKS